LKDVKHIVIILGAVLFFLFILEKSYDYLLHENLNIKTSYVVNHKIDADLLIVGPCVPDWMLSPELLKKETNLSAYNLAKPHFSFPDIYLNLHLYLRENTPPKNVLMFVSPESFDLNYNIFNSYLYGPFLSDSIVNKVVLDMDPDYMKWTSFPFMKYAYYNKKYHFNAIQGLKHILKNKKSPYFIDGFEPQFNNWKITPDAFKSEYPKNYSFSWDPKRAFYFLKIIQLCSEKDIQLILYESPFYSSTYSDSQNRQKIINKTKKIVEKHAIPYFIFDTLDMSHSMHNFQTSINLREQSSIEFNKLLGKLLSDSIINK
jgi:hypothetical protein